MSRQMKILSLSLEKFKPLYLSNIVSFDYKIEQVIQLILGSNGSGKSSLLRVLTPDAPDPKEFDTGGKKRIEIQTEKGRYELFSTFNGGAGKHSFKLNGEELNDGLTVTVFKELVKTEFDYDSSLHKILTGTIGFCQMQPTQRKELLYKLCDLNIDYLLNVFQNVLSAHRDIKGALKHVTSKLDPLTLKMISDEEVQGLEANILRIRDLIAKVTPKTNPSVECTVNLKGKLETVLCELSDNITSVEKMKSDINTDKISDEYSKLSETLPVLQSKHAQVKTEITEVNQKLSDLDKLTSQMGEETLSIDELEEKIGSLKKKTSWVNTTDWDMFGDLNKAEGDLHYAYTQLQLEVLPNLSQVSAFTASEASDVRRDYQLAKIRLGKLESRKERLEEILHHAELAREGDSTCEKCGHINRSTASLSNELFEQRKKELSLLFEMLSEATCDYEAISSRLGELTTFENCVAEIKEITVDRPAVSFMLKQSPIADVVSNLTYHTGRLRHTLDVIKKRNSASDDLERLKRLESVRELMLLSDIGFDKSKIKYYEEQFENLITESNQLAKRITVTKDRLSKVSKFLNVCGHVAGKLTVFVRDFDAYAKASAHTINNETLSNLSIELAVLTNKLATHEAVKRSIDSLNDDREALELKRKRYEDLLLAMSPNRGLIADVVSSVLVKFTDDVNKTIARVWEYPMTLKPFANKANLNYKFPLTTNSNSVLDVSMGSKGQQDVINLAVTLNAMKYRKITGYPLFLDEVGSSFDYTHRQNFIKLIRNLSSTGDCSQIFCVNHFTSDYGGITNADVVVLSPDNIVVPDTHNTNVSIA